MIHKSKAIWFVGAVIASFVLVNVQCLNAQSEGKIGLINIQKIAAESKAGKEARATFERETATKRATLAQKEQAVKAIEDEVKQQSASLSAEVRREKEEALAQGLKELQRLQQDLSYDLKKTDSELSSKMYMDISSICQGIGKERSLSMIMVSNPQIVYSDKSVDITDEVIKRYNALYDKR